MRHLIKKLALPLWAGLLFLVAGVVLPWQAGVYLKTTLPLALHQLAQQAHAQAQLEDYHQGLWQSSARLSIHAPLLREPIELHLHMRHGPWLGLNPFVPAAWGWFSIQSALPTQGGIQLFPTQQAVDAWLYADLFGVMRLGAQQSTNQHPLGEIQLRSLINQHAAPCRGELLLPGFKWLAPTGDLIVADIALRTHLQGELTQRQGNFSAHALRAAWVTSQNLPEHTQNPRLAHAPSVLIELPRIEVLFAQKTQLNAAWASARGSHFGTPGIHQDFELGRMNTRLAWRDVDWDRLWNSVAANIPIRSTPSALNAFTYALGRGEITLEALELRRAQERLFIYGGIHAHQPIQDWHNLALQLNAELNQTWLVEWMLNSGWVKDAASAADQLEQLRQQGWLDSPTPGELRATLDLWRGEMIVSTRRVPLTTLRQ